MKSENLDQPPNKNGYKLGAQKFSIFQIDNIAITLKRLIAHSSSSISSFRSNGNSSNSNQPNRRNLQLIVITHDQRLVDHLYLACRPEYTYGLSKDETGVSHIRMHKRLMDSQALYNAW